MVKFLSITNLVVNRGTWYWECTMEEMPELAATRIGFAQAYGNNNFSISKIMDLQ